MLNPVNIPGNSEFISHSFKMADTIDFKNKTKSDTLLPVHGKQAIKDSTAIIPETFIRDSVTTDSSKQVFEKKAEEKFKKQIQREPDKIQEYRKELPEEELSWNTCGNFLIRPDYNDTATAKSSVSVMQSPNAGNLGSTFLGHDNTNIQPLKREVISNDWLLALFIFIALLFLWVKIFYRKYFNLLLGSLLSYQLSLKLFREKNIMTRRVSFVLNFIYSIVLAVFILRILQFYRIRISDYNPLETLLLLINLIIIISLLRLFIISLVGVLFDSTRIFNEYIHNNYIINKNLGLFLFPLLIMQVYIHDKIKIIFIIAGISLIIISYVIRLYRGFQIIIKKDIFLFYLILYLCTLEILPVLLGYKLFFLLV